MQYSDWKKLSFKMKLEGLEGVSNRLRKQADRADPGATLAAVAHMRFWVGQAAYLMNNVHIDGQNSLPDEVVYAKAINAVHDAASQVGL
jgi:hypothetical protein